MLAQFAARKPPDVFYVDSNVVPDWIKQGVLEPLDAVHRAVQVPDDSRSIRGCWAASSHEGKTYGFPKDWSPLAMQTNTAMLSEAGVARPDRLGAAPHGGPAPGSSTSSGGRADLPRRRLGPPARVRLPEQRLVPERGEDAGDRQRRRPYGRRRLLRRPDPERSRRDAGAARRRLVRRGARQGEGRDHLRGQLGRPVHDRHVPERPLRDQPDGPEQAGGQPRVHGLVLDRRKDSKNKAAAWTLLTYLTGQQGMKTWTSKGLALPSRSDVKPVAGRAGASSPRRRPRGRGSSRPASRR